jgi:GntR family transcriptional regulator/MocR family aminotransferase
MAESLCMSRNTVERAYQQLLVEGYIKSQEKSGYYVEDIEKSGAIKPQGARVRLKKEDLEALGHPFAINPETPYDFCYTNIAPENFPLETWRKLTVSVLHSSEAKLIAQYSNPFGDYDLRKEIARFVLDSRGVDCCPEQVIVLTGLAEIMDRLLKFFSPIKRHIALEEPCLNAVRAVASSNGFTISPLDASNADKYLHDLEKTQSNLAYVTPSHQFPTGGTLQLSSRLKLLDWAVANNAYIIEDDYDSEFRYKTKAIPSLHALDSSNRVIYTGSFSKTLSPNLRVGYMVLPPHLVEQYRDDFRVFPCSVPWLNQRVLYHFMALGHWDKHLRKLVKTNRRKREVLLTACNSIFGKSLKLAGVDAGLHVWAHLDGYHDDDELIALAHKVGVIVYPSKCYYSELERVDKGAFLMGHSKIKEEDIEPGVALLYKVWMK